MSAVLERERRATAGKRMTSLVGEAQQQDDEFWGHDTWQEDSESYHSSSEEEEKDEFDSDFDESESDNDIEELEQGANEERQLQLEIKNQKKRSSAYVETARALHKPKKKKLKGKQMVTGDGLNAGIVLNLPSTAAPLPPSYPSLQPDMPPFPAATGTAAAIAPPSVQSSITQQSPISVKSATVSVPAPATLHRRPTSSRRKVNPLYQSTDVADTASAEAVVADDDASISSRLSASVAAAKKRKSLSAYRFTQEELLLEAASVTEPENAKWLLARKRHQEDLQEFHKEQAAANSRLGSSQVVMSYTSKRGQLNTIHFCDMDHVPEILKAQSTPNEPEVHVCAITGKPAMYKDPKTNLYYFDAAAFKELRRRVEAGEIQIPKLSSASAVVKSDTGAATARMSDDKKSAALDSHTNGANAKTVRPKVKKESRRKDSIQTAPKNPMTASSDGLGAPFGAQSHSNDSAPATETSLDAANNMPIEMTALTGQSAVDLQPADVLTGNKLCPAKTSPQPTSASASLSADKLETLPVASAAASSPSYVSSGSRRASPRRRKPSLKILRNIEETGAPGVPFLGEAAVVSRENGIAASAESNE